MRTDTEMGADALAGIHKLTELTETGRRERGSILPALTALVEPLATIVPGGCEVVLHDLSSLPNSIISVAGSLTGRSVGGPATDLLLQRAAQGRLATQVGYTGHGRDGQELRCSTIIVRASSGEPVAALCINCETKAWRTVSALAASMLPGAAGVPPGPASSGDEAVPDQNAEHFTGDVDDLAEDLLVRAIGSINVPVDLMHKRHKLAVVAELKASGFFILREAAERAARALKVSRFTIYNYLKELDQPDEG